MCTIRQWSYIHEFIQLSHSSGGAIEDGDDDPEKIINNRIAQSTNEDEHIAEQMHIRCHLPVWKI